MLTRALHAAARGLDAVADYLEHATGPTAEHLGRAQVASSLQPRHDLQFGHLGRRLDPMDEHDSFELGRRLGVDQTTRTLLGIEPGPGVTLAVVLLDQAAHALVHHHPVRATEQGPLNGCSCGGIRWGDAWSEHAAAAVFDALPTVQGRTVEPDQQRPPRGPAADMTWTDDPPPAGWLRRPGLEDTDPELVELLRTAGGRWGPLGVAIVAAALTDPNVLVARLRSGTTGHVVPQHDDETEGEKDTDEPGDEHVAAAYEPKMPWQAESPRPGWLWVQAGQATEFIGRTVVLPINRPDVPRGEQVLTSARWAADFDPIPNVVMVKLEGLELEYALARDDRMQVKTQ